MGNESSQSALQGSNPPKAVLSTVSQYDVGLVKQAFLKLKLSHLTHFPNVEVVTLLHCLPLPKDVSEALVRAHDIDKDGLVDWRGCLSGLVFCLHGSVTDKLHTLLHLNSLADGSVTRAQLEDTLISAYCDLHRIYQAVQTEADPERAELLEYLETLTDDVIAELFATVEEVSGEELVTLATACPQLWLPLLDLTTLLKVVSDKKHTAVASATQNMSHYTYRWQKQASPEDDPGTRPAQRYRHATCLHGNYLYIHGGRNGGLTYRDMWRYSIVVGEWERLRCSGEVPASLQEHTMLAHNDCLYVFGGQFTGADSDTPLWTVSLDKLTWRKVLPPAQVLTPCSRRGHTAVMCHNAMHVYGGYVDLRGSSSELWTFDLETETWHLEVGSTPSDSVPGGRHSHTAIVYDNAMWLYGGMTDLLTRDDLWRWDFVAHYWHRIRTRHGPPPLKGHSACRVDHNMILYGGLNDSGPSAATWCFNLVTHIWTRLCPSGREPPPCFGHNAIIAMEMNCGTPTYATQRSQSVPMFSSNKIVPMDTHSRRPASSPAGSQGDAGCGEGVDKRLFEKRVPLPPEYDQHPDPALPPLIHSETSASHPDTTNRDILEVSHNIRERLLTRGPQMQHTPLPHIPSDGELDTAGDAREERCVTMETGTELRLTPVSEESGPRRTWNPWTPPGNVSVPSSDQVALIDHPPGEVGPSALPGACWLGLDNPAATAEPTLPPPLKKSKQTLIKRNSHCSPKSGYSATRPRTRSAESIKELGLADVAPPRRARRQPIGQVRLVRADDRAKSEDPQCELCVPDMRMETRSYSENDLLLEDIEDEEYEENKVCLTGALKVDGWRGRYAAVSSSDSPPLDVEDGDIRQPSCHTLQGVSPNDMVLDTPFVRSHPQRPGSRPSSGSSTQSQTPLISPSFRSWTPSPDHRDDSAPTPLTFEMVHMDTGHWGEPPPAYDDLYNKGAGITPQGFTMTTRLRNKTAIYPPTANKSSKGEFARGGARMSLRKLADLNLQAEFTSSEESGGASAATAFPTGPSIYSMYVIGGNSCGWDRFGNSPISLCRMEVISVPPTQSPGTPR